MKSRILNLTLFIFLISNFSCSDKTSEELVSSITITASESNVNLGGTFNFAVKDNLGKSVLTDVIIYVDNVAVSGFIFQPQSEGSYSVYAKYKNLTSNTLNLKVVGPSPFTQKVLIEDYTGTWCGYCPRVMDAIELSLAQSQDVIPVAIHSSNASAIDPFNFSRKNDLLSSFDFKGYPTARINRDETWSYPENSPEGIHQVISKLDGNASAGIGISSTLNSGVLDISIEVGFHYDQANLNLVVYLLEDKLKATQANYYPDLYGGSSSLVDFEHNNVLRHCLTELFGDAIPSTESKQSNVYQKSFNFTVADSEISNSDNVNVVAFVVNSDSGKVINVNEAAVNSTVLF